MISLLTLVDKTTRNSVSCANNSYICVLISFYTNRQIVLVSGIVKCINV